MGVTAMTTARFTVALCVSFLAVGAASFGQPAPAAPAAPAPAGPSASPTTQPAADAKPSAVNAPGQQYPMVDPQGRAYFRIVAPEAKTVVVGVGRKIPLAKFDNGVWYGTSDPLPLGFPSARRSRAAATRSPLAGEGGPR
jgi:hypothetical protein